MKRLLAIFLMIITACAMFAQGDFVIRRGERVAVFIANKTEMTGAALQMLQGDMRQVVGAELSETGNERKARIVVHTDSTLPREGFAIDVKKGKLLMRCADQHGVAYALLELSRLLGVSPWEWWADCVPTPMDVFTLKERFHLQQQPAVAYRGIFINDEDWGILPWSGGVIGPATTERVFQLLLRLRANTYWPPMHEVSKPFFTIPGNREVAKRYGIYIGGSHCEPMATSPATEWAMRGVGDYNYATNSGNVQQFWTDRVREVKEQQIVYTLGMRGVHDGAMQGAKTSAERLALLQKAIDDQRGIIADLVGNVEQTPQVFIPYKEVLDIYHAGLRVPDDVTLMWTDDNYGYIRHFPDSTERRRSGGNGIYYHISYWGRPHDYLWLSTMSPCLVRQQMTEAYERGVRQMWILNVGDIKPAEYHVEQFLDMAWHGPDAQRDEHDSMRSFYKREFGDELADTLAAVMHTHYQLALRRKPEHIGGTRVEESDRAKWNKFRAIDEWTTADVQRRVDDCQRVSDAVECLASKVDERKRDAYFQLVKYPVQAAAQMNFKFLCPERSAQAYDSIVSLTHIYNSNPRWRGIMDMQPRRLAVFNRVDTTLVYPEPIREHLLFDSSHWQPLRPGETLERAFTRDDIAGLADDSVTVEVRLLPNHPVEGQRLAFAVAVDGHSSEAVDYQTYDRSEEWKRNVLRNYAVRRVTLPIGNRSQHQLTIRALTEGVLVKRISLINR